MTLNFAVPALYHQRSAFYGDEIYEVNSHYNFVDTYISVAR